MTVLIASQNLKELEDFCDHVSLLHRGGLLFSEEIDQLRLSVVKAQIASRACTFEKLRDEALLSCSLALADQLSGRRPIRRRASANG